jgi:hypothetical protein
VVWLWACACHSTIDRNKIAYWPQALVMGAKLCYRDALPVRARWYLLFFFLGFIDTRVQLLSTLVEYYCEHLLNTIRAYRSGRADETGTGGTDGLGRATAKLGQQCFASRF